MNSIVTSIKNPRWANAEQTAVDCEITTSQFNDEVLPFTASATDSEAHCRIIFNNIITGQYGTIAEYVPPVEPEANNP